MNLKSLWLCLSRLSFGFQLKLSYGSAELLTAISDPTISVATCIVSNMRWRTWVLHELVVVIIPIKNERRSEGTMRKNEGDSSCTNYLFNGCIWQGARGRFPNSSRLLDTCGKKKGKNDRLANTLDQILWATEYCICGDYEIPQHLEKQRYVKLRKKNRDKIRPRPSFCMISLSALSLSHPVPQQSVSSIHKWSIFVVKTCPCKSNIEIRAFKRLPHSEWVGGFSEVSRASN